MHDESITSPLQWSVWNGYSQMENYIAVASHVGPVFMSCLRPCLICIKARSKSVFFSYETISRSF